MKIEARHVRRKQLSQYIDANHLKRERKVSESLAPTAAQLARKRLSSESVTPLSPDKAPKRPRHSESVSVHFLLSKSRFSKESSIE